VTFLDKYFPLAPHPLKVLSERRKRRQKAKRDDARRIVALLTTKDGDNACLARGSIITDEDMARGREELYSRYW